MKNSKLDAIAHLELSFAHNKTFKKAWNDYIELCIIEAAEEKNIQLPNDQLNKLVKASSEKIINTLFSADWWRHQDYIK